MNTETPTISEEMAAQFIKDRDALRKTSEIQSSEPVVSTDPQPLRENRVLGENILDGFNKGHEPTGPIGVPGQPGISNETYAPAKITSLGKAKFLQENEARKEYVDELRDNFSWKNLPVGNLPSQGLFYPEGTQISIRAALSQEIRNFSTIDETDFIEVDEKLNMIVEKCARIMFEGQRVTYKELLELDRFYIVYAIREMTFINGENKLQMQVDCPDCGGSDLVTLTKENFDIFDFPEKIRRFYDGDERAFIMTLKESGEKITLYLPTLGVTNFIKHYVRKRSQANKNFDKAFLNIAPFLFPSWRTLTDNTYDRMNEESFGWSLKKISAVINVVEILQNSVNPEITHNCKTCNSEVKAPLNFQGGVKGLFLYTFDNSGDFFNEIM